MKLFFIQEIHEGLVFSAGGDDDDDYSFGIFSVKFSTDGRELVAASSDGSIYVYDLEGNRLSLRIPAHTVLEFYFCKYIANNYFMSDGVWRNGFLFLDFEILS